MKKISGLPSAVANENLSDQLTSAEIDEVEADVARCVNDLLDALLITRDHNTDDTPRRVAKMFVREIFAGRYQPMPKVTEFPNAKMLDELYTVGPLTVRSTCAHHFCPVMGKAWIGVVPNGRLIGLSKFSRLTDWIMTRPQIQEEATVQLADLLERLIEPRGLGVVVEATHTCMTQRGVREHEPVTTSSVMRGLMSYDSKARLEFLSLIKRG